MRITLEEMEALLTPIATEHGGCVAMRGKGDQP